MKHNTSNSLNNKVELNVTHGVLYHNTSVTDGFIAQLSLGIFFPFLTLETRFSGFRKFYYKSQHFRRFRVLTHIPLTHSFVN